MKHFFLQVLSILLLSQAFGQIRHSEYFFDTDPGFGNGSPLTFLAPASDTTFSFNAGIGALSAGIHTLYVRSYDSAKGAWGFSTPKMFYKEINQSHTLANIVKAEYFIDTDPGFGNANNVGVTAGQDITFTFNRSIAGLTTGLHRMGVRTRDANGQWSQTTHQLFYYEKAQSHSLPNIVKAEYFFDIDPGFGNANNVGVTAGQDITFTFNRSISSLITGLHRMGVRTLDANGRWSQTTHQLFYFEKVQNHTFPNISQTEFFFDTDPGFGNGYIASLTPGQDIAIPISKSISNLTPGIHRFFVRSRDANGRWSHTTSQMFYYEKVLNHPLPNIVKAEYFIDTDPGFGNANNVGVTAGQDISFTFNRSISGLTQGLHRLFVRTRDANGDWSHTTMQMFYYEPVLSHPLPNIVKAEFFFDTDPGFGNGTNIPVTAGQDISFTFNGNINSLNTGLHRLFVRTQDINGNWSHSTPQLFYRESVLSHTPGNLVRLEWFWDTDPGFGNANSVSLPAGQTEISNFTFPVTVSGFSNQIHNLYVRVMDDWSHTTVVKVDFTNIVLPVTLLSFNARTEGNKVKLEWEVTSELNMDKYIVEHSIDGNHFSAIGERDAIANNGGEANYMLYHNNPVTGINYYRLRQIERDGNFEYSQIVAINFSKGLNVVSIFPNPATSFFKIETSNRIKEVRLVDLTGKLLITYPNQSAYSLENIPAGAYLVRIYLSNGQIISKPIVVGR